MTPSAAAKELLKAEVSTEADIRQKRREVLLHFLSFLFNSFFLSEIKNVDSIAIYYIVLGL